MELRRRAGRFLLPLVVGMTCLWRTDHYRSRDFAGRRVILCAGSSTGRIAAASDGGFAMVSRVAARSASLIVLMAGWTAAAAAQSSQPTSQPWPPERPRVALEIERGGVRWGDIVVELDSHRAPITVAGSRTRRKSSSRWIICARWRVSRLGRSNR